MPGGSVLTKNSNFPAESLLLLSSPHLLFSTSSYCPQGSHLCGMGASLLFTFIYFVCVCVWVLMYRQAHAGLRGQLFCSQLSPSTWGFQESNPGCQVEMPLPTETSSCHPCLKFSRQGLLKPRLRLTLNSWSFCLYFPNSGIGGLYCHTRVTVLPTSWASLLQGFQRLLFLLRVGLETVF